MRRIIVVHSDPEHSWFAITMQEVRALGIEKQISSYSCIHEDIAYLEEDCDAGIFLGALKKKFPGIEVIFDERHTENTPIRTYASFHA